MYIVWTVRILGKYFEMLAISSIAAFCAHNPAPQQQMNMTTGEANAV